MDEGVYFNEDNGYIVLTLDCDGDPLTVTGGLGIAEPGEMLKVTGSFAEHPRFGMQFNAVSCERALPSTESAILRYLGAGSIKGIGPTLAGRIVDKFGTDTLNIIENSPEKLATVKGVSASKAEEICLEYKRIHGSRALMLFLGEYGIPPGTSMQAWRKWGQYAEPMIRKNPFIICDESVDAGFAAADRINSSLGLPNDSPERVLAGIKFILTHNTANGHTCLPTQLLKSTAEKLLKCGMPAIEDVMETALDEEELCSFEMSGRDFTALKEYSRAEEYISSRICFMDRHFRKTADDFSKQIDIEEKTRLITYAEKQKQAIKEALSRRFLILTGGPGTGKTTTLKAMISLFEQAGLKVMITAPTGRAAKRISDLTGYPSKTIHRLLEVTFDNNGRMKFRHNEKTPLSADVMVVDEMSMVDTLLFESLLRAMKLSCGLIMVGDSDQLPSVGAGNVLRDLTGSGKLTTVRLTEIFRQARESRIITNAHMIVHGEYPVLTDTTSDFFFLRRNDPGETVQCVCDLTAKRLPDAYSFSPMDDIQVLCPSRKGITGSGELNRVLQERLNPPSPEKSEIKAGDRIFRDGDKIMQCRNNYDIEWKRDTEEGTGIYNGDIGTVVKVVRRESIIITDFEGRIAKYPLSQINDLEHAYAITVHKSQGSEFNAVILPLLGSFEKLYYRNLLYTAVTRAKKLLIIVGSREIVDKMVDNDRRTLRYTTLCTRIREEYEREDD